MVKIIVSWIITYVSVVNVAWVCIALILCILLLNWHSGANTQCVFTPNVLSHSDALAAFVSAPRSCFLFRLRQSFWLAYVQPCKRGSFVEKTLLSENSLSWHTCCKVNTCCKSFFFLLLPLVVGNWWWALCVGLGKAAFDLLGRSQLGRLVCLITHPMSDSYSCVNFTAHGDCHEP